MSSKQIQYVSPKDLLIVGLDDEREDHPLWDPRAFKQPDEDLIRNIMTYGIFQPVQVRREDGKILVVDGRQRVKAAREAAARQEAAGEVQVHVPIIEQGGEDKRITGIMISANEQRSNDEVLEKANKAQRMLDLTGDIDEVCVAFGKTRTTINNYLLLNRADPRIHQAIREKKISASAGIDLAKLPRENQASRLEELLKAYDGGKVPVSATKQILEQEGLASDPTKANASSPRMEGGGGGGGGSPVLGEGRPETEEEKKPRRTSPTDRPSHQAGIKRSWLRKAIKSEAAEKLSNDQMEVLRWFAYGETVKGSWFDDFQFEAEAEMKSSAT